MKAISLRSWCALALLFAPSLALAADPPLADWARQRVQDGIVKPLAQRSGSRFSRERPPPLERRVRVEQTTATLDKSGHGFVTFAVDVRFGSEWHEDLTGCVYKGSGSLFVKRADGYVPASYLLGKRVGPVAGMCEAADGPKA